MNSLAEKNSHEEDTRSFEGIEGGSNYCREVEEEAEAESNFFNFKEDESQSQTTTTTLTWSPFFEDLDDSGHFTASPDGERALSGSSRSHSPCPSTASAAHLLLQMQHHELNPDNFHPHQQHQQQQQQYQQQHLPPSQLQFTSKPLISPRSVMTVKVPHGSQLSAFHLNSSGFGENNNDTRSKGEVNGVKYPHHHHQCHNDNGGMTIHRPAELALQSPMGLSGNDTQRFCSNGSEESSEYLKNILDNFNSLYMEKLRMIDDIPTNSEEQKMFLLEKKTNMLENWAKDVCIQNMVLVHTVEELEKEANRKVEALQSKITESTQLAKEHMNMIKKYEQQVKLLLKNHSDAEEKNLVLKIELEKLKSECRRVKDRMNSLLKDNESLITLVCRIRDMGVWDVNGLELQRTSFDQIFGLYPNLAGGEVQTVFTKEKARHMKETEEKVEQLESQLKDLQKTHNQVEAESLVKDRKIEELETEIKNVSNKVQYCEQECNDYKRSLLETQEKLLEATRKLNSSKYSSRQQKESNQSEMAELIKELRDVKTQLNAAVEEKQTAKEESNYFKRELSERLKEMHDIQNVFQSLATEVVNSRAAFQQVQEKEVQLQSLKSEVQTYQSRCADAEDIIRKKEREITKLQRQMNEIHRRSKKQPSISSHDQTVGGGGPSRPDSAIGKFCTNYLRNISSPPKQQQQQPGPGLPTKPKLSLTKPHRDRVTQQILNVKAKARNTHFIKDNIDKSKDKDKQSLRPPWDTNFKGLGLVSRPPPAVKQSSKSSLSRAASVEDAASTTKRTKTAETEEGIKLITEECENIFGKLADIEKKLSKSEIPLRKINNVVETQAERDTKQRDTFRTQVLKLPKVPPSNNSSEHLNKKHSKSKSDPQRIEGGGLKGERLPKVKEPTGSGPSQNLKDLHKKSNNPVLRKLMENPLAATPRLNELITAVVETSKQLLGNGLDSPVMNSKDISSFTVTAARYRKGKRKSEKIRRAQSTDKNRGRNLGSGGGDFEDVDVGIVKPKKYHSTGDVNRNEEEEEEEEDLKNDKHQRKEEDHREGEEPNMQDILLNLPQDSHEDIVKSWIKKSSEHSLDKDRDKGRGSRRPPLVPRATKKPSVKVMKHLATRRYPRRLSTTAESKQSSERTEDVFAEMFELEDEWGKVFANIEGNNSKDASKPGGGGGGDEKAMGKSGGSNGATSSPNPNSTAEPETLSSSSSSSSSNMASAYQCNEPPTNKCQDEPHESVQELLTRLAAEKREMEERFQKELRDKDIELRMQKVTIQHLQDAYVALKRGQPIPVPQSVTGNKIKFVNGSSSSSSNGHHNPNPNQVLDV